MSITLNIAHIDDVIRSMDKFSKSIPKATSFALNGSTGVAQTRSLKNVRDEWKGIKANSLKLYAIHRKATVNNLSTEFTFKSKAIPLYEFSAKQITSGVSYKLKGGRKKIKSAFIKNSTKGRRKEHVLIRTGNERYPLRPMITVTPTHMFIQTKSQDVYIDTFLDHFGKNYRKRLDYLLSK